MRKCGKACAVEPQLSFFVKQLGLNVNGNDLGKEHVVCTQGDDLFYLAKKAKDFSSVDVNFVKFLNSVAGQKKKGRVMTEKQINYLIVILNNLADNNVIKRDSIDGDIELCKKVLDAIER